MDHYRSNEWKSFRREVMRLDGYACTICGVKLAPGVVLQVHHKHYFHGRKPWEYRHDQCATVCKGCHAAEHGMIPPKIGWEHVGWDDLGDLTGTCEYCGTDIRYVFLVYHPKWRTMEVGEVCCDNLTSTTLASNEMESQRRFLNRRKTFVSSTRWRRHEDQAESITHKGYHIEVLRSPAGHRLRIEGKVGKQVFVSQLEAKVKAFDVVESGDLKRYLSERAKRLRARNPQR